LANALAEGGRTVQRITKPKRKSAGELERVRIGGLGERLANQRVDDGERFDPQSVKKLPVAGLLLRVS
jgi:hypothetical protein